MALIQDWLPPTRDNYNLILTFWQFAFPIVNVDFTSLYFVNY